MRATCAQQYQILVPQHFIQTQEKSPESKPRRYWSMARVFSNERCIYSSFSSIVSKSTPCTKALRSTCLLDSGILFLQPATEKYVRSCAVLQSKLLRRLPLQSTSIFRHQGFLTEILMGFETVRPFLIFP